MVTEAALGRAWSDLGNSSGDLCQALIRHGVWTPEQANYYLNQARMAYQSGSMSGSDSVASGVTAITPTPMVPSSTGFALGPSSTGIPRSSSRSPADKAFSHPDYEIDKEISRGGMGVVFKARGKEDGKPVALKVIKAESPSIEFIERFKLEARALERLDHPHIVGLHGFSWEAQTPFIAMEWVDGVPLDEKIKEHLREHGTVPPFEWTRKVHDSLAKALQYCHENGMVHRDIKPANILIEKDTERAVLVDFGLLKRDASQLKGDFQSIAEELTKSGQALGTPQFMAPEQLNDKEIFGEIGPKVDVWGLGASLYFCLVGHAPYQGSSIQIYKALIDRDPAPPGDINDQIPLALDELCQSCLTRDSAARISMGELIKAFSSTDLTLSSHRKVSKLLWIFAVLTLSLTLILAAGTMYWLRLDRTAPKLTVPVTKLTIGGEPFVVTGSVEDENGSHVLIQWEGKKIKVPLSETNEFSLKLDPPKKLRAALKMVAFDKRGNKSKGVKVVVSKDSEPPVFTVEGKAIPVTYDSKVTFAGTCNEEKSQIVVDGKIEGIVVDGGFKISVPVKLGDQVLALTCIDPFGNQSAKKIKIRRNPRLLVGSWSEEKPTGAIAEYESLQEAVNAAKPQTQIMIAPGRYPGELDVPAGINSLQILGVGKVELIVKESGAIRIEGRGVVLKSLIVSPTEALKRLDTQIVKAFRLVTVSGTGCLFEQCEFNQSPGVAISLKGTGNRSRRVKYDLTLRNSSFDKN
ncbi:MAG: protein kinase, partial [Planctomycetota bacterium]|nr:protein kinase [Planctomycetota bacterium]